MRIASNLAGINVWNNQKKNNRNLKVSSERLSTGKRINRASDDAAGLAISQKMQAQIRGLNQASRNAQDGISLIQTAEGAIGEMVSITQRMRELCVQGANGTLTKEDSDKIQLELDQLKEELNSISNKTSFNDKHLLDGSLEDNTITEEVTTTVTETKMVPITKTITEMVTKTITETITEEVTTTKTVPVTKTIDDHFVFEVDLDMTTVGASYQEKLTMGDDEMTITFSRNKVDEMSYNLKMNGSNLGTYKNEAYSGMHNQYWQFYGIADGLEAFNTTIKTSDGTYDDGFISVGYATSADGNNGGKDIYVARYSVLFHEEKWVKSLGTVNEDEGVDLLELDTNSFLVIANTYDSGAGDSDALLYNMNKNGDINWTKTIGGSLLDCVYQAELLDGNIILLGTAQSTDGDLSTLGAHSGTNAWFVKLDPSDGSIISQKLLDYPANEADNTVIVHSEVLPDNTIVAVGERNGHQFITNIDGNGNALWSEQLEEGYIAKVSQMSDGGYAIMGVRENGGANEIILTRLDASHAVVWTQDIGDAGISTVTDNKIAMDVDKDDNIVFYCNPNFDGTDPFHETIYRKVDKDGNQVWTNDYDFAIAYNDVRFDDGGFLLKAGMLDGSPTGQGVMAGTNYKEDYFRYEYKIEDLTGSYGTENYTIDNMKFTIIDDEKTMLEKVIIDASHEETVMEEQTLTETITKEVEKEVTVEEEKEVTTMEEQTVTTSTTETVTKVVGKPLYLQLGSNGNEGMIIEISSLGTDKLGFIDGMPKVYPIESAEASISLSNQALEILNVQRSKLGAKQNSLEHTIRNLNNTSENLHMAESRIADADMAEEMMEYTKVNILKDVTNAMMVQSNQMHSAVLELLK